MKWVIFRIFVYREGEARWRWLYLCWHKAKMEMNYNFCHHYSASYMTQHGSCRESETAVGWGHRGSQMKLSVSEKMADLLHSTHYHHLFTSGMKICRELAAWPPRWWGQGSMTVPNI